MNALSVVLSEVISNYLSWGFDWLYGLSSIYALPFSINKILIEQIDAICFK